MSNAVSALNGAHFEGFAKVTEAGLRGMVTLRGDLSDANLQKAAMKVAGVDFPGIREITQSNEHAIAWMSPDELLITVPYAQVTGAVEALAKALGKQHHLAANVSDARALFRVEGAGAAEVLAKLSPFDVASLAPGQIARSRAGQVAAAFWSVGENAYEVVTFRSTATYTFDLLSNAAKKGSEVGFLTAD